MGQCPRRTAAPGLIIQPTQQSSSRGTFPVRTGFNNGMLRGFDRRPGRMTQIFSPSADTWLRLLLVGVVAALSGGLVMWVGFARSDYYTGAHTHLAEQPVPFS